MEPNSTEAELRETLTMALPWVTSTMLGIVVVVVVVVVGTRNSTNFGDWSKLQLI